MYCVTLMVFCGELFILDKMNNPEIYWPRIDTEDPDNMLSVYALAQSELPGELVHDLDDSGTPWSVADEMFYKADEAYRAVFSGGL